MVHLMGKLIAITFLSVISSYAVQASICDNPLDSEKNGMKGKINFTNVIQSVKLALQKTNLKEIEKQITGDYCANEASCYVEFKVARNKSLGICVISPNDRKCIEIKCECKEGHQNSSLNLPTLDLTCEFQAKNDLQKHSSCQDIRMVNTTEDKHSSSYQQEWTSLKGENMSNEKSTVVNPSTFFTQGAVDTEIYEDKGGLSWFTVGAFVVGFVCGVIISTVISYMCNRRKKIKVQNKKSELSKGQDIPLFSSDLTDTPVYSEIPEQKQHDILQKPNSDITHYSSPVHVGEYLEPVKRNGHTTPRQDNQSSAAHVSDVPKHGRPTETSFADQTGCISDPYNHVYSHLQPNFESQHRLQENKEQDSKLSETDPSMSNSKHIKEEHDEDSGNISHNTAQNILIDLQEQQISGSEIGSYSACIPFALSDVSEKEDNDSKSDSNQMPSHNKENEYFVLEKKRL